jgi:hypothetical protein
MGPKTCLDDVEGEKSDQETSLKAGGKVESLPPACSLVY